MNLNIHILIVFFCGMLFIPQASSAQNNLKKGNRLFDLNQYEKAIPFFEKDMKSRDKKVKLEATSRLADCYRLTGDFKNAEKLYRKLTSSSDAESLFKYGLALKAAAKYAEAKQVFERYVKRKPEDPNGPMMVKSCDFAQEMLDAEIFYDIRELKIINTTNVEISPAFYKGGIIFSSQRPGGNRPFVSFGGGPIEVLLDLYYMNFDGSEASLGNKLYFFPDLNGTKHEGPASFTADGKTIYYTTAVKGKRLNDSVNIVQNTLQIFKATLQGDSTWTDAKSAFKFNSSEYSVLHPSVSSDGKKIFFASDMPGGYGGTDLYVIYLKKDSSWTEPFNLGPDVNTSENELYPFYNNNGKIYFSSNGHPGMGKLDIFEAVYDTEYGWTDVNNLRVPINSIGDDICYIEMGNSGKGMFVSDRINGTGKDDIYAFAKIQPIEIESDNDRIWIKDNSAFNALTYTINKEGGKETLEMEYKDGYWSFAPEKGVDYILSVRKDGFSYNKVIFKLANNKNGNRELHLKPRKGDVAVKVFAGIAKQLKIDSLDTKPVVSIKQPKEKFKNKINRALMGTTFQEYPMKSMVAFEEQNIHKDMMAESGIHVQHNVNNNLIKKEVTNKNGTADFVAINNEENIITLVKNAESKKESVVPDKIKNKKPTIQYTEEFEIVKVIVNVNSDSKSVSKASVIIYLGDSIIDQGKTNSNGVFEALVLEKKNYVISVTKEGYFQSNSKVSVLPAIRNSGVNHVNVELAEIVEDVAVKISNIYYESNKWEVTPASKIELDRLVLFLAANRQIKMLRIFSHTDNIGDEKYNVLLSQRRANSIKDYLIQKGVDKGLLESVGMGETDPLIEDAKSENDHALNRRTEFKIILK